MLTLIISLLVVLNPLSTVPAYAAMHPHTKGKLLSKDAIIVASSVFAVLATAAIAWQWILWIFWLEIEYFRIAGWLVVARVAWNMAQGSMWVITIPPHRLKHHKKREIDRGLIIPLVMPLTAGPGTIALVISHASSANIVNLLIAIAICAAIMYVVVRYGSKLTDRMWESGLRVMTRIIGILLLGLALQIIITTIMALW